MRREGTVRAKIAAMPSAIEVVERDVFAPLGGVLGGAACLWYPTLGLGFAGGSPADAASVAEALAASRRALEQAGGSLVLLAAPESVRAGTDSWGAKPSALGLMRAVKLRLDPGRRLAPGRFVGGI
jgi:glycolate oxidase FAD binding subunit